MSSFEAWVHEKRSFGRHVVDGLSIGKKNRGFAQALQPWLRRYSLRRGLQAP